MKVFNSSVINKNQEQPYESRHPKAVSGFILCEINSTAPWNLPLPDLQRSVPHSWYATYSLYPLLPWQVK